MRRHSLTVYISLLLLPVLLLAGCLREENDFVYDLDSPPRNLDPQSAADAASRMVIANIFEGLVTLDAEGKICPGAAESWKVSPDGMTYTFTLRKDGSWSSGDPVTAADFVYAFQRLFDPDTNAPGAADFLCIAGSSGVLSGALLPEELGVRALDSRTLEICLERYNARFLELLSTAPAMPCQEKYFLKTRGKYGLAGDKILGNGAFYLSSWTESGTVRLRPSATYYGRENMTATSLTLTVPEEGTRLERVQKGGVSAAALNGAELAQLGDLSGQEVLENSSAVWGLVFRTDREPFSEPDIRRALFLDADFSTMELALPEYYERTQSLVSKSASLGGRNYRALAGEELMPPVDREEAAELFRKAAARLSSSALTGVKLILPAGHEGYFAYLSQIWQRDLGLYLTVEALEPADYEKRLMEGDYDCALVALSGSGSGPAAALSRFSSDEGLLQMPEFDALLDQAVGESSVSRAAALYLQAEQMLIDRSIFLPFYCQTEYFVSAPGVSGVSYRFDIRMPDFRFAVIR